ncbi:MAG: M23 family metallopeptidase [Oscillospiraceae bacterium]|nr:M23 family metallopeptidase [Oscillospiraceae bacterium]
MSNNKSFKNFFSGKGYYIALVLCAAAIGISGYLYYRNAENAKQSLQNTAGQVEADASADVAAVATQGSEAPTTKPTTGKTILKTAAPVSGETVAEYAVESLRYNETTRDWRTHSGIDIAAEAGTTVCAAADGVVYTTYTDDELGTTVVIAHEGGFTTKYSSLSEELSVGPGDAVTLGQAIGTVGTTALLENTLAPHVHFSVTCNDEAMDPLAFIAMGQ